MGKSWGAKSSGQTAEFTGERVIPNLVDPNLFNEHLARYRFAARFCARSHGPVAVLDAGCGSGYGTAELAGAASVTAADISAEALIYARENFARPGVRFVNAACEALPFADDAFDLITAFEVIEHLERWPDLLTEARRVLKTSGILLVSTPNKAYYAEMRAKVGPNPFHSHEFEFEEFQAALYAVFPHVRIWAQNHAESIVFAPFHPAGTMLEAGGDSAPENAHFFVAACSASPLEPGEVFAWLPSSGNVLRERELHIAKLEGELARKDEWLDDLKKSHTLLQAAHDATLAELRDRTLWAQQLDAGIAERSRLIEQLQDEADERLNWIRSLEKQIAGARAQIERLTTDLHARTEWAFSIEAQLAERTEHVRLQSLQIAEHIADVKAQSHRIEELEELKQNQARQIEELHARLALISGSKWIRLGRSLNLGPVVDRE